MVLSHALWWHHSHLYTNLHRRNHNSFNHLWYLSRVWMPFAIHTVLPDHHYLVQGVGRDNPAIWITHCGGIDTINGQTFVATFKTLHSVTPVLIELFPHRWQSSVIVIPVMLFGAIKNLWPQEVHSYSRLMTVVRASSDNLRRTQPLKFAFCLANSQVVLHNVTLIGRINHPRSRFDISLCARITQKTNWTETESVQKRY